MKLLNLIVFIIGAALAWHGKGQQEPYIQSLISGLATTFIGLGLGVLFVNIYIGSKERSIAAKPLVKLIAPAVHELHNARFVKLWHTKFGVEKGSNLIDIYQRNKRNPRAFSPEQRDEIIEVIKSESTEIIAVYDVLIDQFRELNQIAGWSFDPKITAITLEARLNFIKFKSLIGNPSDDQKYEIIESYLDGEAAATTALQILARRIGLKNSDIMEDA